jgi:hypothetical protein
MKSALLLVFVLAAAATAAQIPSKVVKEFDRIHKGARFIEWKTEWGLLEDLYRVTYTNWYRQSLVFNRDGEILISESELPEDYIPKEIHAFMKQHLPHAKYVVWDSFDEHNSRSYFVICNESQKLFFTNDCVFKSEVALSKSKKPNLLSIFTARK